MSAEIILLNKLGVAIAADSAITVGKRAAIFNNAQKIFPFPENIPLAFLYFSSTELMGIPIDVIFRRYMESVQSRKLKLSTIRDYLQDLVQFVEKNSDYFTFQAFEPRYLQMYFSDRYQEYLQKRKVVVEQQSQPLTEKNLIRETFLALKQEFASNNQYNKKLQTLPANDYLQKKINPLIKPFLQVEAFGRDEKDDQSLQDDEATLLDYFSGFVIESFQWVSSYEEIRKTSIYLAGYGHDALFPAYGGLNLFCTLKGKVIYNEDDFGEVSQNKPGLYKTLAQDDAIESFLTGHNFESLFQIGEDLTTYIKQEIQTHIDKNPGDKTFLEKIQNLILKGVDDTLFNSDRRYRTEFEIRNSLSKMGLLDLADYAENLINLQTIRRKYELSLENQATVGGPINVAIIDKYQGVRWYKVEKKG